MTFVQMMKYFDESRGAPGPMNFSHQPGLAFDGVECAWLEAERPVCRRITLEREELRVPHVS